VKTRSDSKLAVHEDFIFERLVDDNQSYQTVADAMKKELGISTSASALSIYYSRNSWRWRAERAAQQSTEIEKALKVADFGEAKAKAIAQREFELAASNLSVKDLVSLKRVDQRERSLNLELEKLTNSLKTAQEKALDALFEDIKGNPKAEELFFQMRDALSGVTEEAVKNLK
jgi:hypothetical protein